MTIAIAPTTLSRTKNFSLGQLSQKIMEAIWQKGPSTVSAIKDALSLSKNPAYTTVATILDRLYKRGFLKRRVTGKSYLYSAAVSKERFAQKNVRSTINELFKGHLVSEDLVVSQFLNELAKVDKKKFIELEKYLKKSKS